MGEVRRDGMGWSEGYFFVSVFFFLFFVVWCLIPSQCSQYGRARQRKAGQGRARQGRAGQGSNAWNEWVVMGDDVCDVWREWRMGATQCSEGKGGVVAVRFDFKTVRPWPTQVAAKPKLSHGLEAPPVVSHQPSAIGPPAIAFRPTHMSPHSN